MVLSYWISTVRESFNSLIFRESNLRRFFKLHASWLKVRLSSNGSILIIVLWILILITFLSSQYLSHNREKADISRNAWTAFMQRQSILSVIQLFSTDAWPIPNGKGPNGDWFRLFPNGQDIWVRVENESKKLNLNNANDSEIKQKITQSMLENHQREADAISDAILDWRDEDDLTRMHGAEEKDYKALGLPYRPANGQFNTMSELLMVMGITQDLFWGDPVKIIEASLNKRYIQTQEEIIPEAVSEIATVYASGTKRISMLLPGNENSYLYTIYFMGNESGKYKVIGNLETMRVASQGFDKITELEAQVNGLDFKGKKRS
jgi:hypothetical protein